MPTTGKKLLSPDEASSTPPRLQEEQIPMQLAQNQQDLQTVPPFEYNNRTFESYKKWGIVPEQYKVMQDQETAFLQEVDPNKLKDIRRVITKMLRTRQPAYEDGGKRVIKDFLVFYENWFGERWDGNRATTVSDHVEGWYMEQDVEPLAFVNNRPTGKYKRIGEHKKYYLEFTKNTVDKVLEERGNITHPDEIIYHIELQSGHRAAPKYIKTFT
ncbi:MAG TPA: hypothetical protein VGE97_08200, partial [Nitrososphaera sp.]